MTFTDWFLIVVALIFMLLQGYWGRDRVARMRLVKRMQSASRRSRSEGRFNWHRTDRIPPRLTTGAKRLHAFVFLVSAVIFYAVLLAKARRTSLFEMAPTLDSLTILALLLLAAITTAIVLHFAWREYDEERHFEEVMHVSHMPGGSQPRMNKDDELEGTTS